MVKFEEGFLEVLSDKIRTVIAESPVEDLKKNSYALLQQIFAEANLVSREEFDIQTMVLHKTQEKLLMLEQQIIEIEKQLSDKILA